MDTPVQPARGKLIAILLVVAALLLALYVIWRVDTAPRTDDAYAYADTINVAPEVSGRIVEMAVKENQAVKKGDLLFRIDQRPYRQTLAKARAALLALDKEIGLTQRSVDAQKYGADAAIASVERARLAARQANDTLERMAPLLGKGYVAAEQVDQARTAARAAQAQLLAAQHDAQRATAGIGGVDALVARREVARAEIALAELNLDYTIVRAPFDGRVTGLSTTAGQFAAAGHPVFTLIDSSHWYVVANFRETELSNIRPGSPAQVYLMSDSGRHFNGTVESVGFGVFPDDGGATVAGLPRVGRSINWVRVAQRFPVRIKVEGADPALFRIGTSAVASITGPAPEPRAKH
ncbi:multidrug transporter subunit MdtN [Chitiniphilus eburneus]|uniref:Multidrug transporter subunit MdtN n=1 Tax=Chitiniphilus eburneus TaxID=2571148 RepID=A0A4U0PML4_9NEIS|nr:multidrug transporter subunit MdtN [Chitiniphilus eburneus]TJZ69357.1 multidrug transporter subunit MdtN [Chitiniphilus eburneus]